MELQHSMKINCCSWFYQNEKRNNNQTIKANVKVFVRPGNQTPDIWHRSLMRYL